MASDLSRWGRRRQTAREEVQDYVSTGSETVDRVPVRRILQRWKKLSTCLLKVSQSSFEFTL